MTGKRTPIWRATAIELGRQIARGERSPVEILDAYLERCRQRNPVINALVYIDEDGAREAARAAEARMLRRERLSALDGIPVTVKDNLFVGGMPATWGSRLYARFTAPQDDLPIERLRNAGLIILGKTNTPEFAMASHTDNALFGPTRNPWRPLLTPGGSSGGAVAGLAAGFAPLAVGTDAGGSIRRPAAYTGVVGFRPSTGRIPRVHGFPPIAFDYQAVAPAARTVADTAQLFRIMAGPDRRDRSSMAFGGRDVAAGQRKRMRVRWFDRVGNAAVEPAVQRAVQHAARRLAEDGNEVVEIEAPFQPDELERLRGLFSVTGLRQALAGAGPHRELAGSAAQALDERSPRYSAEDYFAAMTAVHSMRRAYDAACESPDDVLLMPTSASLAWPIGEAYPDLIAGRAASPRDSAVFLGLANALGLPAISLPGEPDDEGMPVGIQLVGQFGEDQRLLLLAARYERIAPWAHRWPAED